MRGKGTRGGYGRGGMANMKSVMVGGVTAAIGLIMIGLSMTIISDMLGDTSITWSDYPGGEDLWQMVPMLMGVGLIIFGVMLGMMGMGGRALNMREAIATPLVAIVMVILAPIIIGFVDSVVNHTDAADFIGLDIFTLVPMLWAVAVMFLPGVLGYLGVRGGR